jgi:GT2 family glycosyltransferase
VVLTGAAREVAVSSPVAGRIAVVTLLWRNEAHAEAFIESLEAAADRAGTTLELVAVQNGPEGAAATEVLRRRLAGMPRVQARLVHLPTNVGFAGGANEGCRAASCDLFVLANLDVVFDPDFVVELMRAGEGLERPAFLAPSVTSPRPRPGTAGVELGALRLGTFHAPRGVGRLPRERERLVAGNGSCIVFDRALYERRTSMSGGLFDPEYHSYYEDVDLFWWARQVGVPVWFVPRLRVQHYHGGSFGGKYRFRDRPKDVRQSVMANYRITVWKHATGVTDILRWLAGECGYLMWCLRVDRCRGPAGYLASWWLSLRRVRAIRSRRGSLRDLGPLPVRARSRP